MLNDIINNPIIVEQMNILADCYRDLLDSKGITASGNLKNFTVDADIESGHFIIIFNLADYWKYVENGRGPGKFPPIDSILDWIRVKPVIPRAVNGKIPSANSLAYLIGRKISREGTIGQHPLKEAIYSAQSNTAIEYIKKEIISQIREDLIAKIKD